MHQREFASIGSPVRRTRPAPRRVRARP